MDNKLPIITAESVMLRAIDWQDGEPEHDLGSITMLWDTGAHTTLVPAELFPQSFQDYLNDLIHDAYRYQSRSRV